MLSCVIRKWWGFDEVERYGKLFCMPTPGVGSCISGSDKWRQSASEEDPFVILRSVQCRKVRILLKANFKLMNLNNQWKERKQSHLFVHLKHRWEICFAAHFSEWELEVSPYSRVKRESKRKWNKKLSIYFIFSHFIISRIPCWIFIFKLFE